MTTPARLLYCMGPSGAGKDSLLAWLRAHMGAARGVDAVPGAHAADTADTVEAAHGLRGADKLHWAQRTISRAAAPGAEAHESVSPADFAALCGAQAFALHWHAHGLGYGVRHAQLAPLAAGRWVLLNGSRAHLAAALARYPTLLALHITASPQLLRARLLARGREAPEAVEARVQRALAFSPPAGLAAIEVHNNGALADAGRRLLAALGQVPGWPG